MRTCRNLLEELIMSTTALTAAVTQLSTDITALIALQANSVPQSSVDAITAQVTTIDQSVQAAIAAESPAPAPTPAPAA
jgi:predicted extracellular nuclease